MLLMHEAQVSSTTAKSSMLQPDLAGLTHFFRRGLRMETILPKMDEDEDMGVEPKIGGG